MPGRLDVVDYLVIGCFFGLSVSVGVYHCIRDYIKQRRESKDAAGTGRRGTATDEYLLAGRQLPLLPTTLSTISSFMSGILLLAVPADVFNRGTYMFIFFCAGALSFPFTAVWIVPRFYALQLTSIYELFELQFGSRLLRRLTSGLFIVCTLASRPVKMAAQEHMLQIYMAVTIYAPTIAIESLLDTPFWMLAALCGGVCTLYTALGGLKAVVWADTLQAAIMYTGLTMLIVKGVLDAGGIVRVWDVALQSHRLDAFVNFDPSLLQYQSVWISVTAGFFYWLAVYGLNQMAQQRYCNLPSCRDARIVVGLSGPGFLMLGAMATLLGLAMLAYYDTCAPPDVSTVDQYVLRFAVDVLGGIPGLLGIFMVTIFSGTLSTVSSGINSMSAVIWVDFIKPTWPDMSDTAGKLLNMAMVLGFGVLATSLTFICLLLKGLLNTVTVLVGALTGPVCGLFLYALFVPRANRNGGLVGLVAGCACIVFIAGGHIWLEPYARYRLGPDADLCDRNSSDVQYDDVHGTAHGFVLFRLSAFAFTLTGTLAVLLTAVVAGLVWPVKRRKHKPKQTVVAGITDIELR